MGFLKKYILVKRITITDGGNIKEVNLLRATGRSKRRAARERKGIETTASARKSIFSELDSERWELLGWGLV